MSDAAVESTREWMATQETMGDWGGTTHDRRAEYDDDLSPRGAARAFLGAALGLDVLRRRVCFTGARVLDLGAGFGCLSSELRKLAIEQGWPPHITGVELNPAREAHGRKWCDEWASMEWREFLAMRGLADRGSMPAPRTFDLIIGNPPFSHILRQGKGPEGERTDYMPVDETMVPTLLRHAPAVLLLHTAGAFDDSEHGREVWRRYPPAATWLCGRLSFRAGSSTDSRTYYATLWLRGHKGPAQLHMLPELPPKARKWTTPPGSEDPDTARTLGLPMVGGAR